MFCPKCHREFEEEAAFCPFDGGKLNPEAHVDTIVCKPTVLAGVKLNDRFEIRGFLGKGATARVYLARDGKDGKPVAVKVLEPEFAKDKKMRERFKREAEAVNAVGHPAIPYLLDMDEHDGAPYIVMEYLFGESLGDLLNRGGALTLGTALLAMRRCAGALAATHQKGIVHRDIKPDNIFLVGEKGNPYEAKVVDFGFARLRSSSLTAAGIVLGTVNYMAPEQVVNDPLDSRTDVYALGMVMYRVFTGRSPYDAKEDVKILAHQLLVSPPRPSRFAPKLQSNVERVIMTAVRKSPDQRYGSMDNFFADILKLAAGSDELWAPESYIERDVYQPRSDLSKQIGMMLAQQIGQPSPW